MSYDIDIWCLCVFNRALLYAVVQIFINILDESITQTLEIYYWKNTCMGYLKAVPRYLFANCFWNTLFERRPAVDPEESYEHREPYTHYV